MKKIICCIVSEDEVSLTVYDSERCIKLSKLQITIIRYFGSNMYEILVPAWTVL